MGKYSHGFYHKPTKDNKLLPHDLGNHDHQKNYVGMRCKLLEFQVGGISVERSDTFWQTGKAEPKCLPDVTLGIPLDEIQIDDKLYFVKEPMEIMDREVKHLKQTVMSSASSAVTYTSVYTKSEPERVFWGADEELLDGGSPRVIVYGYDGLPMQPVAPLSPDYIHGPEEPQTPLVP
ncbi:hypothetical protein Tco_0514144 [Tanacetum coccineum]